jgi:hypothetical protein
MKKKLLIILGAGSSIACGMPSVGELETLIEEWSDAWANERRFSNHYRALKESIGKYYCDGVGRPRPILNFEKVLGEMIALSHWMTPAPFGDPLRQIVCMGAAPTSPAFGSTGWFDERGPFNQLAFLLIQLARYFRSRCLNVDVSSKAFLEYRALADGLSATFNVGVYSLNYDTLVDLALPWAFTGFDSNGNFIPVEVHRCREWGFTYYLHGSVHYSMHTPQGNGQIVWRDDLTAQYNDGDPNNPRGKRSEGKLFPNTTLVAGGLKLDQLLVEPFHSLQASLVRHVYEADAILIGGYGFGDEHVNRALGNRLETDRPPVMVLDKTRDCADPMFRRYDFWTTELTRTLEAPRGSFQEPGSPERYLLPGELAAKGAFEVSHGCKVALWYGGFVEAVSRLDAITEWLSGADDSVLIPAGA